MINKLELSLPARPKNEIIRKKRIYLDISNIIYK